LAASSSDAPIARSSVTRVATDNLGELCEEELAGRARAGCAQCFGVLAERYRPRLVRCLAGRLARPDDAEDIVQDALAKAYAHLHQYDPTRPFANWLFTVAIRLACSHGRRLRHEVSLDQAQAVGRPGDDPHRQVEAAQQRDNLWTTARRLLKPNQHQALWLRYGQDLSVKAVAQAMKISSLHARVLLHRARKTLLKSTAFERAVE